MMPHIYRHTDMMAARVRRDRVRRDEISKVRADLRKRKQPRNKPMQQQIDKLDGAVTCLFAICTAQWVALGWIAYLS